MDIKFIKAERKDANTIHALYELYEEQIIVEWSNTNPISGKTQSTYAMTGDVICDNEQIHDMAWHAINEGDADDNPSLNLYLYLRDRFDAKDCESL